MAKDRASGSQQSAADWPRAGVGLRGLALLIDMLFVAIPFAILAIVLYAQTGGLVRSAGPLSSRNCEVVRIADVPPNLLPPRSGGTNTAERCVTSTFGYETSRDLVISDALTEGVTTTTLSVSYSLDAAGNFADVYDLDPVQWAAFIILLIVAEWRFGATPGKWLLLARVIDRSDPQRRGIPLGKAVARQLMIALGSLPVLAVGVAPSFMSDDAATVFLNSYFQWTILALLANAAWLLWIAFDATRKVDPVHDRVAGTAVVRKPASVQAKPPSTSPTSSL